MDALLHLLCKGPAIAPALGIVYDYFGAGHFPRLMLAVPVPERWLGHSMASAAEFFHVGKEPQTKLSCLLASGRKAERSPTPRTAQVQKGVPQLLRADGRELVADCGPLAPCHGGAFVERLARPNKHVSNKAWNFDRMEVIHEVRSLPQPRQGALLSAPPGR